MAITIISMLIGFYVIEAFASLFLIHGASNNKKLYLVPWMIERATQLIFYTILWLSIGLYFFTSSQTIGYSLFAIVFGGFSLCKFNYIRANTKIQKTLFSVFNFYCFLCVYSLFSLMRDAEEYRRLIVTPQQSQAPNYSATTGTTYVKI